MKSFLTGLCAAALLAGCAVKKAAPEFDTAAMDALLSTAVETGEVIGVSALIYDEGQVVYKNAFGLADRERDVPVTEDTVFRIYSMTKPITSALIMDLAEEGKIKLDDPVAKYIPELGTMMVASLGDDGTPQYAPQAQPMTIKDLLLHRAGLAYGIFGPVNPLEEAYVKADLMNASEDLSVKMQTLSKLPLLGQPGDGWYYSYSIDVLGRVAEVVTGERLGDLLKTRFFDPLGMTETSFRVREDQAAVFASSYFLRPDGTYVLAEDGQTSPFLNDNAFQSGGGGLVSTLGDYSKFAQMMIQGGEYRGRRILDAATVKAMMTDQMDADDKFLMPWLGRDIGRGFGYGGAVVTSATAKQQAEQGSYPGQWGWGGAARTNFYADPANDAFGIIMLQFFGGEDPDIHDRFQALSLKQTRDDKEGE